MTKKQKKWQERVLEWRGSGKTSVQFCEGKGFSPSVLRHWAWRLRKLEGSPLETKASKPSRCSYQPRLARIVTKPSIESCEQLEPLAKMPAYLAGPELVIEIGVVRIGVRRGVDPSTLSTVLDVLGARRALR